MLMCLQNHHGKACAREKTTGILSALSTHYFSLANQVCLQAIFTTARTTEFGEAAGYSQVLSTIEALESYVISSSSGMPLLKELGTFASRED